MPLKACPNCGAVFYESKSDLCVICAMGIILEKINKDQVLEVIKENMIRREKGGKETPILTWNLPKAESYLDSIKCARVVK